MNSPDRPSAGLAVLQTAILLVAAIVFLWPLATPWGLGAALLAVAAGGWVSFRLADPRWRLAGILLACSGLVGAGQIASWILVRWAPFGSPSLVSSAADVASLSTAAFAITLFLRVGASRHRPLALLELALVMAASVHALAAHRALHIHQPRALADWAWGHGIDPETVLVILGLTAFAVGVLSLLRGGMRLGLAALLMLMVLGAGTFVVLHGPPRLGQPLADGLGFEGAGGDPSKGDARSNASSSQQRKDPVAVVLLSEELPALDALYFRQSVRSRVAGRVLEADRSKEFDTDVPTAFPTGTPVRVVTPEAPEFHRSYRTTMFLLADHADPPGLGFPQEFAPVENPNPRRFVAAYSVQSLLALRSADRLLGRMAIPESWSEAKRSYYTALPEDSRYRELALTIARGIDPRFFGDDVMKAFAVKDYLEKKGFYTLTERDLTGPDPIGAFLFGKMRGYCVHFAHAAVFLLRALGIPARVAIGYAVQTMTRGAGSAITIYGNEAHAWPELYLDGVGWVTFDIYPEQSDTSPVAHVDQGMEAAMGELARGDRFAGRPQQLLRIPWAALASGGAMAIGIALLFAFLIKGFRRIVMGSPRRAYRGVLDALSGFGLSRRVGETREAHAHRVATWAPTFILLTGAHLRMAFHGGKSDAADVLQLAKATLAELHTSFHWLRRALAAINPATWMFTR